MRMKLAILILSLVAVVVVLVACKPKNGQVSLQDAGVVVFSGAGVSLDVGTGWQRIDISPGLPVCPPTLVGEAGMIRAMLFAGDRSDVNAAADSLRAAFEGNTGNVKDSFRQEEFKTDGGVQGVHLSYTSRSEKDGNVTDVRSHNYIVKNREGRCVSISYMATAEKDAEAVHEMIRRSLKLQ